LLAPTRFSPHPAFGHPLPVEEGAHDRSYNLAIPTYTPSEVDAELALEGALSVLPVLTPSVVAANDEVLGVGWFSLDSGVSCCIVSGIK
jgi:hypothetical protein